MGANAVVASSCQVHGSFLSAGGSLVPGWTFRSFTPTVVSSCWVVSRPCHYLSVGRPLINVLPQPLRMVIITRYASLQPLAFWIGIIQ